MMGHAQSSPERQVSVLVLGQVPPPYHGQAVMISTWLSGVHRDISIDFVPMRYSESVDEVGRFRLKKIYSLVGLLGSAISRLVTASIDVVYYPPAGAGREPLVRDILSLLVLRRFRRPIVFHFHAMGLEATYRSLGRLSRWFFRAAYFRPDVCICLAASNVAEVAFLQPAKTMVIPYGIPDLEEVGTFSKSLGNGGAHPTAVSEPLSASGAPEATVLFLGNLIPTKGVWRLLRLALRLGQAGENAKVVLIGAPPDSATMAEYRQHPAVASGRATFLGPLIGREKEAWLQSADVFCFPSSYESENFPVVLIEALRAGLPVVSTNWRGIPEIVEEARTGLLVDPEDEELLFQRVLWLLRDERLRRSMAMAARASYVERFTADEYVRRMDRALWEAGTIGSERGNS